MTNMVIRPGIRHLNDMVAENGYDVDSGFGELAMPYIDEYEVVALFWREPNTVILVVNGEAPEDLVNRVRVVFPDKVMTLDASNLRGRSMTPNEDTQWEWSVKHPGRYGGDFAVMVD